LFASLSQLKGGGALDEVTVPEQLSQSEADRLVSYEASLPDDRVGLDPTLVTVRCGTLGPLGSSVTSTRAAVPVVMPRSGVASVQTGKTVTGPSVTPCPTWRSGVVIIWHLLL
jgi:hypothetical protein